MVTFIRDVISVTKSTIL